jgi:hypothetical protein
LFLLIAGAIVSASVRTLSGWKKPRIDPAIVWYDGLRPMELAPFRLAAV